ncbi:ATP-binding cassette domain-containing protein [Allohahella marinimesophila]|uniref:ATP-binding protein Uup n=1 Tax=Allohahella marinimesophila TaxID=1054972 RepID=A0ABP7NN58_9GAMM
MPLLHLDQISLAYGMNPLLDNVSVVIERGEKVALVGRNGEGKSTLLRLLSKQAEPDSGEIRGLDAINVGVLDQDLPERTDTTVFELVAGGLAEAGELITRFHELSHSELDEKGLEALSVVQSRMEALNAWQLETKVEAIITQLGLKPEVTLKSLSGGWRRRALLGRALVSDPDLLLLDEPTNHLDIPAIEWLEGFIRNFRGAVIVVTHDRRFLANVVNRVLELDRGNIYSVSASYPEYLEQREKRLQDEATEQALFDKRLAEEEVWIRQGIKARRTRNEGRVRALKALRVERSQRREQLGKANIELENADKSGKLVIEAEGVTYSYNASSTDTPVVKNLKLQIQRGDRIGIVGSNGCGKSTLLKLLLGDLTPDAGKIRHGTKLQIAYFDQLRNQLDPKKTVIDNVSGGQDFIEINGKRKHIIGYLGDFLFPPARARTPLSALSGGERNRVLLAKLFTQPANLLVMDEPTNDLDVETLEMLEELLTEYKGTLLLVSHDREFLDQVVTSTLAYEGQGRFKEYVGGYTDWVRQGHGFTAANSGLESLADDTSAADNTQADSVPAKSAAASPASAQKPEPKKKLSYKLERELQQLPVQIETLETSITAMQLAMAEPGFFARQQNEINKDTDKLARLEAELASAMERWLELESM